MPRDFINAWVTMAFYEFSNKYCNGNEQPILIRSSYTGESLTELKTLINGYGQCSAFTRYYEIQRLVEPNKL